MLAPPLGIRPHPNPPALLWPWEHWAIQQQWSECQVHRLIVSLILIANGGLWRGGSLRWTYLSRVFKFIEDNHLRKRKVMVVTTGFGGDSGVSYHLLLEISSPSPGSPRAPPRAEESRRQDELDSLSHQTLGETLLDETTLLLSPEL